MTQTMERAPSMDQAKIAEILEKLKDSPMVRGEVPAEVTNASQTTTEPTAAPTAASAGGNTRAATQIRTKQITNAASYLTRGCYQYANSALSPITAPPYYAGLYNGVHYFTAGEANIDPMYDLCKSEVTEPNTDIILTGIYFKFRINDAYNNCDYDVFSNWGNNYVCRLRSVNREFTVPFHEVLATGCNNFAISLVNTGGFIQINNEVSLVLYYIEVPKLEKIPYGTAHELHEFDIHFPKHSVTGTKVPAVLTIHGGNWTGGSKLYFDDYTDRIIAQGCAHINMNYRLIDYKGDKPTKDNMLNDIESVIRKIKTTYSAYIDTSKLALMGWSAGGHLALMYACERDDWDNEELIPIKLVISEAGPTCLYAYDATDRPENEREKYKIEGKQGWLYYFACLLGVSKSELTSVYDNDLQNISPRNRISGIDSRQRILSVYSLHDMTVVPAHARLLAESIHNNFPNGNILREVELNITPQDAKEGYHNEFEGAYAASTVYRTVWASELRTYKSK